MRYCVTNFICRRVAAVTLGLMIHVGPDYAQLPFGSVQVQYTNPEFPRRVKVNNGRVIAIRGGRVDSSIQGPVEAFDQTGRKTLSANPLDYFTSSLWATVTDAAVGAGGLVAIAGFRSDHDQMAPFLLIYSAQGQLLHVKNLPSHRAILRVAMDEADDIWAFGYAEDSKQSPLIFWYGQSGETR